VPEALPFKPVFNEKRWADVSNGVTFLRARKKYRENYSGVTKGGRSKEDLKYDGNGKHRRKRGKNEVERR
jgi:hypothetical protein